MTGVQTCALPIFSVVADGARDALARLEAQAKLAYADGSPRGLKELVAGAAHVIVQVTRFGDGVRRISGISEVVGVEGDGYTDQIGGLNAFFLLVDRPEVYKLPARPTLPSRSTMPDWLAGWGSALVAGLVGLLAFRQRRMAPIAAPPGPDGAGRPTPPAVEPARPAREYVPSGDQGEA